MRFSAAAFGVASAANDTLSRSSRTRSVCRHARFASGTSPGPVLPRAAGKRLPARMVFTGIVEEMGVVEAIENLDSESGGVTLTVASSVSQQGSRIGDSISINGTCLSITHLTPQTLSFGLVPETLNRTNLGRLAPGQRVNMERSMSPNSRFGGHIVQGHVDCTGTITEIRSDKDALWFYVRIPREFAKYVVEKGYIAVDGTSLTVVDALDDSFSFTMIPITQASVVTASKKVGDLVNVECDITGKYIERMLSHRLAA